MKMLPPQTVSFIDTVGVNKMDSSSLEVTVILPYVVAADEIVGISRSVSNTSGVASMKAYIWELVL